MIRIQTKIDQKKIKFADKSKKNKTAMKCKQKNIVRKFRSNSFPSM